MIPAIPSIEKTSRATSGKAGLFKKSAPILDKYIAGGLEKLEFSFEVKEQEN